MTHAQRMTAIRESFRHQPERPPEQRNPGAVLAAVLGGIQDGQRSHKDTSHYYGGGFRRA